MAGVFTHLHIAIYKINAKISDWQRNTENAVMMSGGMPDARKKKTARMCPKTVQKAKIAEKYLKIKEIVLPLQSAKNVRKLLKY